VWRELSVSEPIVRSGIPQSTQLVRIAHQYRWLHTGSKSCSIIGTSGQIIRAGVDTTVEDL
jgi:hypothetical protein